MDITITIITIITITIIIIKNVLSFIHSGYGHYQSLFNRHVPTFLWYEMLIDSGSSTSLYYISLSLGFGNIAQGGDPL